MKHLQISSSTLKIIACICMLTDHLFAYIFANSPLYTEGRLVGRVAFILYAYLIGQGIIYTHNTIKYIGRLFLLALISEPIYDFCKYKMWFCTDSQNAVWVLLLGALSVWAINALNNKSEKEAVIISITVAVCACFAWFINADYSTAGVLLVVLLYLFRYDIIRATVISFPIFVILLGIKDAYDCSTDVIPTILNMFMLEYFGLVAYILLYFYNGEKGKSIYRPFFYLFYPLHLLVIAIYVNYF